MKPRARRLGRWLQRTLPGLLLVAGLPVAVLLYPVPLFNHDLELGRYHVYGDQPLPPDIPAVIDDAVRRVQAMEHVHPDRRYRVFLCSSHDLYSLFAFLTRRGSASLGIGLALPGNIFVNVPRVQRFAARGRGVFAHSRFEGNLAEVIAHEIAHFNSLEALGFRAHLGLPVWKSEGWAEYQANIVAVRGDDNHDLEHRIDLLLDDRYWGAGRTPARQLYEWHLLVEFLGDVRGVDLAGLAGADVTEARARHEMLNWHRRRNPPSQNLS
jgi:hypothetical protein